MKSILKAYTLATAQVEVLHTFDTHIEAPNWLPDGGHLLYNAGGRLYRYDLATEESEAVDTGSCVRCNNDHVLSPDGKHIGISSGTEADRRSRVWIGDLGGGQPRLITSDAPSYLHGWSPDGKTLAYCAERNGNFDVYAISVDGGAEIRLTDAEGLDDGPEYTPSGKHIWFNSVRSGLMQLYRMRADGSAQKRMTASGTNDWFPHVSPDGAWVVYVAYDPKDVAPGDHPANKNVCIRLLSSTGGDSVELVRLFGGQGTMNVNSWSPDSRRFAFVTYEL